MSASAPNLFNDRSIFEVAMLTEETFDRARPYVARYAEDPRRAQQGSGVLLKSHESFTSDDAHRYGRLTLRACQKSSGQAVADAILNSEVYKEEFPLRRVERIGHGFSDRENWKLQGIFPVLFTVQRERFPVGDDPDFLLYQKVTEGEPWEERYSIGTNMRWHVAHSLLPLHEIHHTELRLEARTDREYAKLESAHKVDVIVKGQGIGARYTLGENMPTKRSVAYDIHKIRQMRDFLSLAKDLRPVVDPINKVVDYREFITSLWNSPQETDSQA